MNAEIAMKATGLREFGGPEVLGIATKEEPHARTCYRLPFGRLRWIASSSPATFRTHETSSGPTNSDLAAMLHPISVTVLTI